MTYFHLSKGRRRDKPVAVAADISLVDALDLLHKFVTEATPVRAVISRFTTARGTVPPAAAVVGVLRTGAQVLTGVAEDLFVVVPEGKMSPNGTLNDFVVFNPAQARSIKYGDERLFTPSQLAIFPLISGVSFIYSNELIVSVLEIPAPNTY
jgi:hypothetical protein